MNHTLCKLDTDRLVFEKKNTCETSIFSVKFISLWIVTEKIIALSYNLRMFGIPIDEPAQVLDDNELVVINGSCPGSTLKKKYFRIAYYMVRKNKSSGTIIFFSSGSYNLVDLLTMCSVKREGGPRLF